MDEIEIRWTVVLKLVACVRVEDSLEEFTEAFSLHFVLFDDKAQICLHVDYLTAEMAISFHMGKDYFRIECCQGRNARFVFPPGR